MSWRRGRSYSQDLRERVLAAVDEGLAVSEVAEQFQVDRSYIYKALIRRRLTGETRARPQRCQLRPKLAPYHEALRARVDAVPDATIDELRSWLLATHGVASSVGEMWKTLDRLGLTFKKRPAGRASKRAPTLPRRAGLGGSANPS